MKAIKKLFENKRFLMFLLVLILLAGAAPRGIELLNHNYLFGYDQGEHLLHVKQIVVDKKLTLIGVAVGGQGGFFQGPGWYYLLAIPFILGKGDPYAPMVMMFLIGVGTIAASFFTVKKIFDERTALLVSFLIAISPAIIPQSRFIWPPFPISLLSVFVLYFLYQVLHKKEKYFPALLFSVGAMTHFETATAATLFMSMILVSPVLFIKKLVSFRYFIFGLLALIVTQLPLIIFDFKHNFLNTKGILQTILSSHSAALPFNQLLDNRWNTFRDNFLTTFTFGAILWPVLLTLIVIGLFFFLKDRKKPFGDKAFVSYLALSPFLLFLVFLKYGTIMWSWWILELNISYCFLVGILFLYLFQKKYLKWVICVLLIIFTIGYFNETVSWYKNDFHDFGGVHKIKGMEQALDYIYQDAHGKPFNLLVFSPPIYTYPYDYLLWWYGRQKYGYMPGSDKKGTFYLLIEPDPYKPWSYKGWLETVIKSGTILKTEQLPSGFIIQKREES